MDEWLEMGAALKEYFSKTEKFIAQEKFTDAETIELLRKTLFNWIAGTNLCSNLYLELFKEPLPEKSSDVVQILNSEEKRILEANLFRQARKFLYLVASAPDLKKILREYDIIVNGCEYGYIPLRDWKAVLSTRQLAEHVINYRPLVLR